MMEAFATLVSYAVIETFTVTAVYSAMKASLTTLTGLLAMVDVVEMTDSADWT